MMRKLLLISVGLLAFFARSPGGAAPERPQELYVLEDSAGAHVNTSSDLTSVAGASGSASNPPIVLGDSILLTKSFLSPGVLRGGLVDLEFTVFNTSASTALAEIAFTDDVAAALPGLAPIGLPAADVCGAGSEVTTGSSVLSLTGGSLAAGSSCTFSVTLKVPNDAPLGMFSNTTSSVTGTALGQPVSGPSASADLTVVFLAFAKSFSDGGEPGGLVTLSFSLSNPDPDNPVIGLAFSDDLDAALPGLHALGLPQADVCGAGSQLDGSSVITLTGGVLPAGGSCTFDVLLGIPGQPAIGGEFTNVTSALTGIVDGSPVDGGPASAAMGILIVAPLALIIPTLNVWGLLLLASLLTIAALRFAGRD